MSKVRVYSRFPQALEFRFNGYDKTTGEVVKCGDEDRIVLNGTNEIVNHTFVFREGAATVFGYAKHDVAMRQYSTEDLERLKNHPTFKKLLENGDVSLDTMEDLSKDFTGVGKLTDKELAERLANQKDGDGISIVSKHRSVP